MITVELGDNDVEMEQSMERLTQSRCKAERVVWQDFSLAGGRHTGWGAMCMPTNIFHLTSARSICKLA